MRDRPSPRGRSLRESVRVPAFVGFAALALALVAGRPAPAVGQEQDAGGETREGDAEEGDEGAEDPPDEERRDFEWKDEESLFEIEAAPDERGETSGDGEEQRRRRSEVPLSEMSKAEARDSGFTFGDEERAARRTSSVLLAATAGTALHGIGHWYADDGRTATFLGGAEGISLALAGTGLTTWFLEGDTAVGSAVASKTFHLGAGLFGLSYLLDLVGTIRSGTFSGADGSEDLRGIDIEAEYRYLQARGYPLNHHFRGGISFDLGRVFGRASTEQEFALDGSSYGTELGVRWLRGARPQTFAYAVADVDFLDFRGTGGFERWRGDLRLGASMDLGVVSPHLEGVALGAEAGYGRSWYTLEVPSSVTGARLQTGYLPVEVYSSFDLSDRVHSRVAYEQAAGRRLQATRRLGGVGVVDLVYDSTDLFDLEIGAEFGGGFALSGGFLIHVW